jgi:hypothetical protein
MNQMGFELTTGLRLGGSTRPKFVELADSEESDGPSL